MTFTACSRDLLALFAAGDQSSSRSDDPSWVDPRTHYAEARESAYRYIVHSYVRPPTGFNDISDSKAERRVRRLSAYSEMRTIPWERISGFQVSMCEPPDLDSLLRTCYDDASRLYFSDEVAGFRDVEDEPVESKEDYVHRWKSILRPDNLDIDGEGGTDYNGGPLVSIDSKYPEDRLTLVFPSTKVQQVGDL